MASLLLPQIAVILVLSLGLRRLLRRLDQPEVVCQMLAGVMIGPSLLGLWTPWHLSVFPPSSVGAIAAGGQLGLVIFMFCAGTELDLGLLRKRARAAGAISLASVAVPLAAGAVVGSLLVGDHRLFPAGVSPQVQIAFLGVAVAITAFPVMARIIGETGLGGTVAGTSSLAAGSFTDAIAWCLLALLVAAMRGTNRELLITLGAAAALLAFVLIARSRPGTAVLNRAMLASESPAAVTAGILVPLLLVSWLSDVAGLHPALGAFMFGLAMPRNELVVSIRRRVELVAFHVLLPLYFVSTGLNTSVGSLPDLVGIGLALLATAVVSKGVVCWLVARLTGHSSRDALAIGALMNARGLVELVVLGIGLQHGVITPALFSIMVFVAIITTMMAGPVIAIVYPRQGRWGALRGEDAPQPVAGPR